MSSSEMEGKLRLVVEAADDATEIFVLDARLIEVARARGRLDEWFEPGVYKIKARAGFVTLEERVVLTSSRREPVKFGPIAFSSSAPLVGTAQTERSQIEAAVRESGRFHKLVKDGSSIYVFVRGMAGRHPAEGLSLRHANGRQAADIRAESLVGPGNTLWAACNVSVRPGLYRLRLNSSSGPLEQTVVAVGGWQTQVFLRPRAECDVTDDTTVDLPGASILMAHQGRNYGENPFQPNDPNLRLTELAKLGLASGRQVLADSTLRRILDGKFTDPMLGLLGAHALLLNYQNAVTPPALGGALGFNLQAVDSYLSQLYGSATFKTIVNNLRRLLGTGTHPDVEALGLLLDPSGKGYLFEQPPMLRQSWRIVLRASALNSELVPKGSLASEVADRLWGEDPWLIWGRREKRGSGNSAQDLNEFEEALLRVIAATEHRDSESRRIPLPPRYRVTDERFAGREVKSFRPDETFSATGSHTTPALDPMQMQKLVQILGIPRGNIERLIDKLK